MFAMDIAKRSSAVSRRSAPIRKVQPRPGARGRSLDSLSSTGLGDAFYSWRGASGRRYVFSVFGAQESELVAGFSAAAILGVVREGAARRAVCVLASRDFPSIVQACKIARPEIQEWHVLFGADDASISDLAALLP